MSTPHHAPQPSPQSPQPPRDGISIQFPRREVVIEAIRIFVSNPFGIQPTHSFWREAGVSSASISKTNILHGCVQAGLLIPPGELFGVPHGYLPGPAAFGRDLRHAPVPGLADRPSHEEIIHNARTRVLSQFGRLLIEQGPRLSARQIAHYLNLPSGTCAPFVQALETEGFITSNDSCVLPTEKMEIFIGVPELRARVAQIGTNEERACQSAHTRKREESQRAFQAIKEPLRGLVARHPGKTAHELLAIAQTEETWLPNDTTKPVFLRWMDKLTDESSITMRRQRQGPVRIIQTFFPNGPHGAPHCGTTPSDGGPPA